MKNTMHVLLVEDDESWGNIYLEEFKEDSKIESVWAKSYDEAKIELERLAFDIAIVDLSLSEEGVQQTFQGIQLIQELSALLHPPIAIVSTGYRERAESDPEFPADFVFDIYDKIEPLSKLCEAVERARKLKRVQRLLVSASKYTSGTTPITEELKRMLEQFVKLADAYVCHLLLPTEDRRHLEIVIDTGGDEGRRVEVDDSVTGDVFKTGVPINLGDTRTYPRYKDISGDKKMKSELAAPLQEDSRVIGVLNIESEYPDAFTKGHEDLMFTFADFVEATLQNDRRRQDLQDLIGTTTSQLLEAVVDLEKVFTAILDRGLKLINANSGLLALVEGEQFRIVATTHEEEWPKGSVLEKADSICGLAVQRGYAINVRDTTQEPYKRYFKPALGKDKLSELVVPLRLGGEVIGLLNFESTEPSAFTSEDQRLLVALASQASVAIRVARSYERLKMARQREPLAKLGELSGALVHRINNTLGLIKANSDWARVELMEQGSWGALPCTVQSVFDEIIEDADKVVDDIKLLRRESMEPIDETVDVNSIIRAVVEHHSVPEDMEIVLVLSEDLPAAKGSNRLADVIRNLIDNALRAMKESEGQRLWIRSRYTGKEINLEIEDTGTGIPEILLREDEDGDQELWKPYTTTYKGPRIGSHGFGLWWSRLYVRSCGGELAATNTDHGALCTIVLAPA